MTVEEALVSALEYERKVRDHYRAAADRARDERAVAFFRLMAGEEDRHVAYLEHLLETWRSDRTVADLRITSAAPRASWVKEGLRKIGKTSKAGVHRAYGVDHLEAALRLEQEVSDHYRELVKRVSDRAARAVFRRFLEIEDGHTALVRAELDYVTGTGHFFGIREFTLEGEG